MVIHVKSNTACRIDKLYIFTALTALKIISGETLPLSVFLSYFRTILTYTYNLISRNFWTTIQASVARWKTQLSQRKGRGAHLEQSIPHGRFQ